MSSSPRCVVWADPLRPTAWYVGSRSDYCAFLLMIAGWRGWGATQLPLALPLPDGER